MSPPYGYSGQVVLISPSTDFAATRFGVSIRPAADRPREAWGVPNPVVVPCASDLHADGTLDVYDGAADRFVAAARITLPSGILAHAKGRPA